MKTCLRCKKYLKKSMFHKDPRIKRDGYRGICKVCHNGEAAEWRRNNKAKVYEMQKSWASRNRDKIKSYKNPTVEKNTRLKRLYNITMEDYNNIFRSQNGSCAICGGVNTKTNKNLHVDHDHSGGDIRGLLCSRCNLALGMYRDSIEIHQSALTYLQRYSNPGDVLCKK